MHGQLGDPEVDRPYADRGCGWRADGRATGHVASAHEGLEVDRGPLGRQPNDPGTYCVGGVPLPGVELEYRTSVQEHLVLGIVALRVVRVGGMGTVDREDHRGVRRSVRQANEPTEDPTQDRSGRTGG